MCEMTDLERLAAYDRMYADLLREREQVLSNMEKLRAADKKLTVQNLIGRFEIYGIRET